MKPQLRTSSQNHGERDVSVCKNRRMPLAVLNVGRENAAVRHVGTQTTVGDVDMSAVAGLFSRRTFRALAASQPGQLREVAQCLARTGSAAESMTLADAFDDALQVMSKRYRNEYVFKNTIVDRLVFGRHSPRTAAALLELRAGKSIVDVAVFNGTSTAYEIKTDLDDFSRLAQQLSCYEESFERVSVVTSPRLAPRVLAAVPKYVGVLALTDRGSLSEMRAPSTGLGRLSQAGLFGLLRRQETLDILRRTRGYEIDVPPARLWQRTRELFLGLSVESAHTEVVDELRARGMRAAGTAAVVPRSLRAMAYEVPLNASEVQRAHAKLIAPTASFAD
ncbi:sce7726 family protein [Mycolicibacterium cosmeticum]|uniref:sce7726 family protein n=1 Tax=Mycolicibacterium cosmeticum TaxID=258533 RepID=UPI003204EEA3